MMSDSIMGDLSMLMIFDDLEMIMQQVQSEQQQEEEAERVRHQNYIYRKCLDAEARLMADYFGPHQRASCTSCPLNIPPLLFLPRIFYHSVIRALYKIITYTDNSEFSLLHLLDEKRRSFLLLKVRPLPGVHFHIYTAGKTSAHITLIIGVVRMHHVG
ncbi:hypothetical protein Tco_1272355 [Tanacetum coccineum]